MVNVVFVESTTKCKKIEDILNNHFKESYFCLASCGHITQMPIKELGVDINNNYEPTYEIIRKNVKNIEKRIKKLKIEKIYLASDLDLEGEKISYDIYNYFKSKYKIPFLRVCFNEITEHAIIKAFNNPREINNNMIESQKCRRVIDRLIGYKLTPKIWKHVNSKGSAGRVLSVIVKLIYDREQEIKKFTYPKYKEIDGVFTTKTGIELHGTSTDEIDLEFIQNMTYYIKSCSCKIQKEEPPKPYITSTLHRDISSKFKMSMKGIVKILQNLYQNGHITYIRTDSTNISKKFQEELKKYTKIRYDKALLFPRTYDNDNGAHECIRPTNFRI